MTPYLLEEIDDAGHAFGRIVWDIDDAPELHNRHGALLDLLSGEMLINVDGLGCNSADELIAMYPGLIAAALAQHADLAPPPEIADDEAVAETPLSDP